MILKNIESNSIINMVSTTAQNDFKALDGIFALRTTVTTLERRLISAEQSLLTCRSEIIDLMKENRSLLQDLDDKDIRLEQLEQKLGLQTSSVEYESEEEEGLFVEQEDEYEDGDDESSDEEEEEEELWGDRRRI
jgi:hypothetical protein